MEGRDGDKRAAAEAAAGLLRDDWASR